MEISPQQLQRFIDLYKEELDISLTPVQAQEKALGLIRFLAISLTPLEINPEDDIITMPGLS